MLHQRSASSAASGASKFFQWFLELCRRANAWLSTTFPFLWRTRALVWIAVGLLATAGSCTYARGEPVEIKTLAGLEARLFFLSLWTYVVYGAFLVAAADVVRRTSAVFSIREAWGILLSVSLVMTALALPQYAYVRILSTRVASLETPDRLQALMRFHGQHRFWRCWEKPDRETVKANADVITADLLRYGLETKLEFIEETRECRYSISAWPSLLSSRPKGNFLGIGWFQERLMEIDAAQRYVRGDGGPLTSPLAPNDLLGTVTLTALSSLLTVAWLSTTLLRSRALSTGRRLRRRWTWRSRMVAGWDASLAASWPTVWLSRLHVAFPYLLLPPAVVTVGSLTGARALLGLVTLPLVVVSLVLGFRSQGLIRGLPKSAVREIGTFAIHTALYSLAVLVPVAIFARTWEASAVSLVACMILAAMWQGARNGSVVTTYGGHCAAVAIVAGAILAVDRTTDAFTLAMAFISVIMICEVVLIGLVKSVAAAGIPRRFLVSAILAMAPAPGVALMIGLAPRPRDVDMGIAAIASAIAFAGVVICLIVLHGNRRVVA